MILFWDYFREFWKCLILYVLFDLALRNFYAQGGQMYFKVFQLVYSLLKNSAHLFIWKNVLIE